MRTHDPWRDVRLPGGTGRIDSSLGFCEYSQPMTVDAFVSPAPDTAPEPDATEMSQLG